MIDLNDMSQDKPNEEPDVKHRLNVQTGKIKWQELSRFFASGKAIFVDQSLDLIEVAAAVHEDRTEYIQALMKQSKFGQVTDELALEWTEKDEELWAVVVSPWVLVQAIKG